MVVDGVCVRVCVCVCVIRVFLIGGLSIETHTTTLTPEIQLSESGIGGQPNTNRLGALSTDAIACLNQDSHETHHTDTNHQQ